MRVALLHKSGPLGDHGTRHCTKNVIRVRASTSYHQKIYKGGSVCELYSIQVRSMPGTLQLMIRASESFAMQSSCPFH